MSSPQLVKEFVLNRTVGDKQNIWACLNKGMACLYASDFSGAKEHFQDVLECSDNRDWAFSVKNFIKSLIHLDPINQILFVQNAIQESRQLKKLSDRQVVFGSCT
jgi:hypothetical protein